MSHANVTADLSERNVELGSIGGVARNACLAVGIIGLAVAFLLPIFGLADVTWDSFWRSWLQTWIFVLEISLGAFFFVIIFLGRHNHPVSGPFRASVRDTMFGRRCKSEHTTNPDRSS